MTRGKDEELNACNDVRYHQSNLARRSPQARSHALCLSMRSNSLMQLFVDLYLHADTAALYTSFHASKASLPNQENRAPRSPLVVRTDFPLSRCYKPTTSWPFA